MPHLIFDFIRSRRTIRFQAYPFVIESFCDETSRIPVATQERLKATHFRITCVSLEIDGPFFLSDNRNLTFKWPKLVLRCIARGSEIDNVTTSLSWQRTPSTAL